MAATCPITRSARRPRRPAWGKLALIALACAALAAAWRYTPLAELITPERVMGWARAIRGAPWAPVVVILAYTPAVFVLFPRPLLTLLTVIAFGPWLGFAYGMAGIAVAALVTYCAGRLMRPETVQRLAGDRLASYTPALQEHALAATFALRIVAVAPFVVESVVAGALRIPLGQYLLGTLAGMTPGVLATTVFGREIRAWLEDPSRINYWLLGAVLVAMLLMTWAVKRWFARRSFSR